MKGELKEKPQDRFIRDGKFVFDVVA